MVYAADTKQRNHQSINQEIVYYYHYESGFLLDSPRLLHRADSRRSPVQNSGGHDLGGSNEDKGMVPQLLTWQ